MNDAGPPILFVNLLHHKLERCLVQLAMVKPVLRVLQPVVQLVGVGQNVSYFVVAQTDPVRARPSSQAGTSSPSSLHERQAPIAA